MRLPISILLGLCLHACDAHPVDEVAWAWKGTTTKCVEYCEKIVDGPMAANGDMGVAIGGECE